MKLEHSGTQGMFIGYNENLKAYYIYIPRQQYVVVSHDFRFEEDLDFRRSLEITSGGEQKEALKVEESIIPFNT